MKRTALLKHLTKHKCFLLREGGRHSVLYNPKNGLTSTVPRHSEINNFLGEKICKDLGISQIRKK